MKGILHTQDLSEHTHWMRKGRAGLFVATVNPYQVWGPVTMPVILQSQDLVIPQGDVGNYQPVAWANPAHAVIVMASWISPATGRQFRVPHFYLTQLDVFQASGQNLFYELVSTVSTGLACTLTVRRNDGVSNPFRVYVRNNNISQPATIRMRTINMSI